MIYCYIFGGVSFASLLFLEVVMVVLGLFSPRAPPAAPVVVSSVLDIFFLALFPLVFHFPVFAFLFGFVWFGCILFLSRRIFFFFVRVLFCLCCVLSARVGRTEYLRHLHNINSTRTMRVALVHRMSVINSQKPHV